MNRRDILKLGILVPFLRTPAFGIDLLSEDRPLNVGIIGMGLRGKGILGLIKDVKEINVVAVCDSVEGRLKDSLQIYPSAKGYSDYRYVIEDSKIDAVIIALPEILHYPVTKDAVLAGKHIYLEKTMTHTLEEANKLCALADRYKGIIIQIGHQYRYSQLYHRILSLIKNGELGEVCQFECQYHRNSSWRRQVEEPLTDRYVNWRMYKDLSGGLMTELCSHQVDVLNWFTDSHPLRVTAIGGIDHWKDGRETYDNIRVLYEYPNGIKASVSSILNNSYNGYSIRILGTLATVVIRQTDAFIYYEKRRKKKGNVDGVTGATKQSWGQGDAVNIMYRSTDGLDRPFTTYALLDFARCVREGTEPFSNVYTGRVVAKSVFMANRAAETGNMQYWDDFGME